MKVLFLLLACLFLLLTCLQVTYNQVLPLQVNYIPGHLVSTQIRNIRLNCFKFIIALIMTTQRLHKYWIREKPPSMHNYEYLEILFLSIGTWEGKQMLA